jgi:hypothetical protein
VRGSGIGKRATIRPELPVVLDMLVSEDFRRRGQGWVALLSACPEQAASVPDYRVSDTAYECRRKTNRLRAEAEPDAAADARKAAAADARNAGRG